MSKKNNYIELLRGISVIAVILYHYFPYHFPLGFLGVDVFFLLSGYVITKSLIQKEFDFKSLIQFYNRRIHRLLPGLYIVLIFTICLSLFVDTPHATKNIGQAVISTTTYLSNIFFYTEIDYFDQFQAHSPLVHTWSLSLEEQFYIIFPLILIFAKKRTGRILIFLALFCFSLLFYFTEGDELFKHYMPHLRVWQILLGVLIAHINIDKRSKVLHFSFLILIVLILISKDFWLSNIWVVVASGLSILFQPEEDKYGNRSILLAGALSYSMYLWHQPIIYFASLYLPKSIINFFLILIFTISISYLSFRFIENPWRYKLNRKSFLTILLVSISLLGAGYSAHSSRGFFELKKEIYSFQDNTINIDYDDLLQKRNKYREEVLALEVEDDSILIIGDSKAEDLLCSLFSVTNTRYKHIRIHATDYNDSTFFKKESILSAISNSKKIIFTNTWQRGNLDNVSNIINQLNSKFSGEIFVLSTSNFEDLSSQYFSFMKNNLKEEQRLERLNSSLRDDWQRQSNELKNLLQKSSGVRWIDKEDAFLGSTNNFCIDNQLIIYDTGHLTLEGFKYFGGWIVKKLKI